MKTASLPAIRVEPALREQIAQVLQADESLSSFVEGSVREAVRRRDAQAQFVARGLASLEDSRKTGQFSTAQEVIAKLQARLDQAKAQAAGRKLKPKSAPAR
jgi:predicted transcriptional regulator